MKMDDLLALAKRRGVLWPSAEIYGGTQGLYDYGPLGVALKRRVEDAWAAWFVGLSQDYYLIDPAEILPEAVVRASGHLANFADLEVSCAKCQTHTRADVLLEDLGVMGTEGLKPEEIANLLAEKQARCPKCGDRALSVPRPFNLMFGMDFGATGREKAYLRPETAQGSYLAFARMWEVARKQVPFGIAVIGKAYRNEIAPRQVLFRMRAFTQAELQIFFDPENFPVPFESVASDKLPVYRAADREAGATEPTVVTAQELVDKGGLPAFYVYHMAQYHRFFTTVLGHPSASIRFLEKDEKEKAFYNKIQFDIEVKLESLGGFKELAAVHYRGDYDLTKHSEGSGQDLSVTTQAGKHLKLHVLELTFGVDRNIWGLADSHLALEPLPTESGKPPETRTVWRLAPFLAPVQVGVLPLMKKEHTVKAEEVARRLRAEGFSVAVDTSGSIGRRYARLDEAGTPFAVTIDPQTLTDGTVTLRRRDDRGQERLPSDDLPTRLRPSTILPRAA